MSELVRGDSLISVTDPTGTITTIITEQDYERGGYKARGWTVNKDDWTKNRNVRPPVNWEKERALANLAK